jgi:signal peptide peptidase SppA
MTILLRLADRVLNRPLLLLPEKLAVLTEVLAGRIGVDAAASDFGPRDSAAVAALEAAAPAASRFVGDPFEVDDAGKRVKSLPYRRTPNGVAIVTITGSLVNRGAWVGASSGLTSYEGIAFQIESAARDDKVRSILLDIESPGGEAVGAFETAAIVRKANSVKPVFALVNGMAASAAYAIASGAKAIMSTETGLSGSIGVVLMHADYSRMVDRAGVTPTFIHAGAHKVDGNPYAPLSAEVRGDLQAEVDNFYEMFLNTVAEGRGRRLSAKAARATEARTFIGQAAKAAGLVDEIGGFADLLGSLSSAGKSRGANSRKASMFTQEDIDRARAEGQTAGAQQAQTTAATAAADQARTAASQAAEAAQARIAAILDCTEATGRESLARHLAFKTNVSADDARATLSASFVASTLEVTAPPSIAARAEETINVGAASVDTGERGSASAGPKSDLDRAPAQKGAVAWSSIAATLNAELAKSQKTGR